MKGAHSTGWRGGSEGGPFHRMERWECRGPIPQDGEVGVKGAHSTGWRGGSEGGEGEGAECIGGNIPSEIRS